MSPKPPYVVSEWVSAVAEQKGDAWFRFDSLQGELRNKGLLLKADACGLLYKRKANASGDLKEWKVRL